MSCIEDNMDFTERIYDTDSYCREFEATVISCQKNADLYDVILDKTAFFPEGGGQAPDKGLIGGAEVLDVQMKDEIIIHKTASELKCGETVKGEIDWELRFNRMQRHTGEHILSGVINSLFGYSNVGFHMSEVETTADFDGVLSQSDIEKIENETNRIIWENHKIRAFYPTAEQAANINYRSKLDNIKNLRLVTIEGVDCCACCAPHVGYTGEVGIVKIIDSVPNKGGTRLTLLAGYSALKDYTKLNFLNKQIMKLLSASRETVAEAVERQTDVVKTLRYENENLSNRLAWSELSPTEINGCVYAFSENLSYEALRYCSNILAQSGKKLSMLFSANDGENYIYAVGSREHDTRPIVKELNEAFDGKGGGKPNYAQGKIVSHSIEAIKAFVEEKMALFIK